MYDSNWLLWIHIHGDLRGDGTVAHIGRNLRSYPSLRCHVFARYAYPFHNLGTGWLRKDNLEGKSAFLGINYPFFLDSLGTSEPRADEALPLFKPNCVFAAHVSCRQRPRPRPDWIRVDVNGGAAIGSSLNYYQEENNEHMFEAPMWFVPTLPRVPRHGFSGWAWGITAD